MAGLLSTPSGRIRILDAGAGTGILSAALCDRLVRLRAPRSADFVLVETDAAVVPLLDEQMKYCRRALRDAGHEMSYTIDQTDFVLSNQSTFGQKLLFGNGDGSSEFDAVLMNPPYFKLTSESPHARAFQRIIRGHPNIYALFMATAAALLRPGGELVAITPRSFCSGLYFREFRRWLFERMTLKHIHLFDSRSDTFEGSDVLQENVITLCQKGAIAAATVTVSTSHGADLDGVDRQTRFRRSCVIDDACGDHLIRIPRSRADARIIAAVESWPARFVEHGLQISTGPVVTFRAKRYLLHAADHAYSVPLILPHNIRPFETRWPASKNGKPLAFRACGGSEKLLLAARNYVLLRRFSAKEEHRRLTASCFLPSHGRWPLQIAIENHVNYVYHSRRELTESETLGLAALFNSSLLDRYFRMLSGNTQVNATEIRTMPFPDLGVVRQIGSAVREADRFNPDVVESLVLAVLGIDGPIAHDLLGTSR
ncbi:MAG: hypothetical protein CHACPFDD_03593 [Phycisphaerae bacterium]|nr:hypothetical protein [Phycisphaerae bacterium]